MEDTANMRDYNQAIIEEYRANNGVMSGVLEHIPLLLLTTTGRKSGEPRTNPLGYWLSDGQMVIMASNLGASKHPGWYLNLLASPEVSVELHGERFRARATPLDGDDWERAHAAVTTAQPEILEHHKRTTRRIPYVILERISERD